MGVMCLANLLKKSTDKISSSWKGDWWEGCSFACLPLCLVSDPHRLTQSHSDPHLRDRLTQSRPDPPSPTQIYSNSFNLTQILSVSLRSTQPQTEDSLSVYFRFVQIHAALQRCAQTHADPLMISLRFIQMHAASLKFIHIHSD